MRAVLASVVLATFIVAGCAPHQALAPSLTSGDRRDRFERNLADRERSGAATEADMSVWVEWRSARDLPGAQARLVLGGPDAFRIRVESAFGTALDFGARGDTMAAYVPARRAGAVLDARRDSIGVRDPGRLGFLVWSAAWKPPPSAWSSTRWDDSLLVVPWRDAGDSVFVSVGSHGLPSSVLYRHARGSTVTVRYRSWQVVDGIRWPSQIEFEDGEHTIHVTSRMDRVRFTDRIGRDRLAVRIPADAELLDRAELARMFEKLGKL